MKSMRPHTHFWGLGGDEMIAEGFDALHHVRDLSVTGFVEVLKHLSYFKSVMRDVLSRCEENPPDAAILIDYPGFNIRLGKALKRLGIPVYYYISPQVWAWKKGRVHTMRQFVQRMFVIFPFEKSFYDDYDIPVTFTGHPIVEKDFGISERVSFFKQSKMDPERPVVALLPGSRRNELERLIDPMIDAIRFLKGSNPDLQFAIAGLSSLNQSYYSPFLAIPDVHVLVDQTYSLVTHARTAIVASGTASLEVAYLGTPLVVIYRIAPLSYLIGKMLVHIDHLAMPNLILGERAIPELIQGDATGCQIAKCTEKLLEDSADRRVMLDKLNTLQGSLGSPGCAQLVADTILGEIG